MAATPPPHANPPAPPAGENPNPDPGAPAMPPPPPGTDMTGICFRDALWLSTYPLNENLVFDYFALSPFYDWTCNNEQLRSRSIHPLDTSHLSQMTGNEYVLSDVKEPHLFVIKKQKREGPEKVTPMLTYYVLDGSIYQAPQVCAVLASRINRCIHHISEAFKKASSKLEKIGHVDVEDEGAAAETKTKETVDFREMKRVDHILGSLLRKLPPAPAPPAFPEGYVAPAPTSDTEKAAEDQQTSEAPPVDPILDQGPSKRMKYQ